MPFKKTVIVWMQKFIHGWLIFCIGGVGSLTYFDEFIPGHEYGQHPYHLSILEGAPHHQDHSHAVLASPSRSEALAQQMRLGLVGRFRMGLNSIVAQQPLVPGLAQFFASGLNNGFLLTMGRGPIFSNTSFFGSVMEYILTGCSASLSPPEKPPQLALA